jgi:hypothetical protein
MADMDRKQQFADVKYFPKFVQETLQSALDASDDLHRFVRLIATLEVTLKFLAATAHACASRYRPDTPVSAEEFSERLGVDGDQYPSLGDWTWLLTSRVKAMANQTPTWLWPLQALLHAKHAKASKSFEFIRHVRRLRNAMYEPPPFFHGQELFEAFVEIRNNYAHGSPTASFAKRTCPILEAALGELITRATHMMLKPQGAAANAAPTASGEASQSTPNRQVTSFRLLAPQRFNTKSKGTIDAYDCSTYELVEVEADGASGSQLEVDFNGIYVGDTHGPRVKMSELVRVGDLLRYYHEGRDVAVFNGVLNEQGLYLSYRTGETTYEAESVMSGEGGRLERFLVSSSGLPQAEPDEFAGSQDSAVRSSHADSTPAGRASSARVQTPPGLKGVAASIGGVLGQFKRGLSAQESINMARQWADSVSDWAPEEQDEGMGKLRSSLAPRLDAGDLIARLFVGEAGLRLGLFTLAERMFHEVAESPAVEAQLDASTRDYLIRRLATIYAALSTDSGVDTKAQPGYLARAIDYSTRALERRQLDSERVTLYRTIVTLLVKAGDMPRASAECKKARSEFPNDPVLRGIEARLGGTTAASDRRLSGAEVGALLKRAVEKLVHPDKPWVPLASIGSTLQMLHSGFTAQDYGYTKLLDLITDYPKLFEIKLVDTPYDPKVKHPWVKLKAPNSTGG